MDSMILSGMVRGTVRYDGIVCGVARYVIWYVGGMVWHDVVEIICGTACMVRWHGKYLCRWYGMMARCGGNIIWHGM